VNKNLIYVKSKAVLRLKFYTTKKHMTEEVKLHEFLKSALAGGRWSASHFDCLMLGKQPPVILPKN
jgi:hypothetical protein